MYIEQLYTGCLAEAAYYIESDGEAAVIDPIRDTAGYLEMADRRGAKIKYVFETHFHADFVSGHIDLAAKSGASIVYGPGAAPEFKCIIARDGEEFKIGKLTLRVLHTPGHTPESACYLLLDEQLKPHAVFTGDTLFIGDVGRPDLAVKSDLTQHDLAGMLYDSLHRHIITLPDEVIVYPAHGAGSACGKNISKERSSTIGQQKALNYALQPMSREDFIHAVTDGLTPPPAYFFMDATINKTGYTPLDNILTRSLNMLDARPFSEAMGKGENTLLDARAPGDYAAAHIKGSVNIGLDGQFAIWAASLLDPAKPILLVTAPGREEETVIRLARVGLENVTGILQGGMQSWINAGLPVEQIPTMEPAAFIAEHKSLHVLDVRNEREWDSGVVADASLLPLARLEKEAGMMDKNNTWHIHCAGGYRSMIAASMLKNLGYKVVNVNKGMAGMREAGVSLVSPQAQTH